MLMFVAALERQVIETVCKAHDKLAIREFDLGCVAFVCQVGELHLDMRESNGFDGLPQRHIRFDDGFPIRHIKGVAQQVFRIQDDLGTVFTRPDKVAFVC